MVMATVTLAMSKLLAVILGLGPEDTFEIPGVGALPALASILAVLGAVAVACTGLSGLYPDFANSADLEMITH